MEARSSVALALKDLLVTFERLEATGGKFRSLTESIDSSGPAGRMMMQMLGSFAEFGREMIRERTRAGLWQREPRAAFPGASRRSPPNSARKSSTPFRPAGKPPLRWRACSKFTAALSPASYPKTEPTRKGSHGP